MTIRQMATIKDVLENKMPVSRAMLKNGYSKNSAKSPDVITRSKAFLTLAEDQLPDKDLFQAHRNALYASKWNDFTGEREPDHAIRLKAATEGYRVKGKYTENYGNNYQQINISLDSGGYVPPNNVLNLKPTLGLGRKPKIKPIDVSLTK